MHSLQKYFFLDIIGLGTFTDNLPSKPNNDSLNETKDAMRQFNFNYYII